MSNGRHNRYSHHVHHTGSMPLYITWTSGCCPPRSQPAEDGIAGPRTGRVKDAMARHGRPGQHHHHAPSRPRAKPNSRFCYYADLTAGHSSGAVEERGRSSACSNSLRNTAPFCKPSRAPHAPFCTPSGSACSVPCCSGPYRRHACIPAVTAEAFDGPANHPWHTELRFDRLPWCGADGCGCVHITR